MPIEIVRQMRNLDGISYFIGQDFKSWILYGVFFLMGPTKDYDKAHFALLLLLGAIGSIAYREVVLIMIFVILI